MFAGHYIKIEYLLLISKGNEHLISWLTENMFQRLFMCIHYNKLCKMCTKYNFDVEMILVNLGIITKVKCVLECIYLRKHLKLQKKKVVFQIDF
jgi:hypothetical protein